MSIAFEEFNVFVLPYSNIDLNEHLFSIIEYSPLINL